MLRHSKLRTQRKQNGIFINVTLFIIVLVPFILKSIDSNFNLNFSQYNAFFLIGGRLLFFFQLILWLIRNKIYKGMKYAIYHYIILYNVRRSLLDANYYNKRLYFDNEIADLPKTKLTFSNNMFKGKLLIENIKINKDFKNLNISSALKGFIVERYYLSNDENYHVFEIYDSNVSQQLRFNNATELKEYSANLNDYELFIDINLKVDLYSSLIIGQTGSGKTYSIYSLVIQMLYKSINYNIYFADPKNSSLAVLGEKISHENTATNIEEIIVLLQKFNTSMQERKPILKDRLNSKLEATYADFNFEPHIFIFDEFASFQTVLQTKEKKKRDEVDSLLSEIVLQGRQLGFFIWIVMQKADANIIKTSLRENLPLKFLLGNSEPQSIITTFGANVVLPDKNFKLGEGVYTCPVLANTPKICHFSYLDFDILESVNLYKRTRVM